MDDLKNDFFKVLRLFVVLFSFTSGQPMSALKKCELGMDIYFGLDEPLIKCVKKALLEYNSSVLPTDQKNQCSYTQDLNVFYWTMYTFVSAVNIELKEQFCGRLNEMAGLIHVANPNSEECEFDLGSFEEIYFTDPTRPNIYTEDVNDYYWRMQFYVSPEMADELLRERYPNSDACIDILRTFERELPKKIYFGGYLEDSNDYTEFISNARIRPEDFVLKKRILYNILYHHDLSGQYGKGTYGGAYIIDISRKVGLYNGNDYTPRSFCNDKHKSIKKKDEETSISS